MSDCQAFRRRTNYIAKYIATAAAAMTVGRLQLKMVNGKKEMAISNANANRHLVFQFMRMMKYPQTQL